ncbi:MAG: homoserine O-acetyltransferase [Flavitalea sp.]
MSHKIFRFGKTFKLESGKTLSGFHLAYTTLGTLNTSGDNVVWIFHALTANSDPSEWWPGLVGETKLFDPAEYFIVCVNMPGSCYGSFSPLDENPSSKKPWLHQFPLFTTRDMIRAYQPLRAYLGIQKIHIGIGGSMGGQQLLEWAIDEPSLFNYIFPVATNAFHSPWGIAFNATQRHAIELDPTWTNAEASAGVDGMKVAREIALLSYRHYDTYNAGQNEAANNNTENFRSESYQKYQGEKLARRFNAFSYYFLSKSMDSHHVGRNRDGAEKALAGITAHTLVIGIGTDVLFPLSEQKFLGDNIPGAAFKAIESPYGHDGFLLEFDQITALAKEFIAGKPVVAKAQAGTIPEI